MADALVSQFVEILASMAKEEVTKLLGAEDALEQLKKEVLALRGVLQDAECRAFTDTSIRRWLAGVKDLVYDADDIIDYSRTQAKRMSTEEQPLTEVEGLYSLQSLLICDDEMESLLGWLLLKGGQPAFPMLKSLRIKVHKKEVLLHRCLVDGLNWPKIQHYPQVDIAMDEFFVRYTRDPFSLIITNLKADNSAGGGGATANPEN